MKTIQNNNSNKNNILNIEILGNYIYVYVDHVMEKKHYINWISIKDKNLYAKKKFNFTETPKAIFPYIPNSTITAHCSKNEVFSTVIK